VTSFDFEPEDSYDAGDPVDVIARNLARRLELLAVDLAARAGAIDNRGRVRLAQLVDDLAYLRGRLGA